MALIPMIILMAPAGVQAVHRAVVGMTLGLQESSCENANIYVGDEANVHLTEFPVVLLRGEWNFSMRRASDGFHQIVGFRGTVSEIIDPGINEYEITIPGFPIGDGAFKSCTWQGRILGYAVEDRFTIGGPCVVEVNTENDYPLFLTQVVMGNTIVEKVPLVGDIFANGSRLFVRKQDASGAYVATPFVFGGEFFSLGAFGKGVSAPGESDDPGGLNPLSGLKFISTGIYEIEVVWRMAKPPNGLEEVLISRAKKLVQVNPQVVEEVAPRGTGGTSVKTLTFQIDPNIESTLTKVAFVVERQAGKGGHEAGHHTPSPADGKWEIMEGTEANPITHPTGNISGGPLVRPRANSVAVTYGAPEFGGRERVRMFGVKPSFPAVSTQQDLRNAINAAPPNDVCELGAVEIKVKVPDLVNLENSPVAGINFDLVGAFQQTKCDGTMVTSAHRHNHWGKQALVNAVEQISDSWGMVGPIPTPSLRINDMSVGDASEGFGGGFDVGNHWGADLMPPPAAGHQSHRKGTNADIGFCDMDLSSFTSERIQLRTMIKQVTGKTPLKEAGHYHTK